MTDTPADDMEKRAREIARWLIRGERKLEEIGVGSWSDFSTADLLTKLADYIAALRQRLEEAEAQRDALVKALSGIVTSGANSARTAGRFGDVTIAGSAYELATAALASARAGHGH